MMQEPVGKPLQPQDLILEIDVPSLSDSEAAKSFRLASLKCRSGARLVVISGLCRLAMPGGGAVPDPALTAFANDEAMWDIVGQPGTLGDGVQPDLPWATTWLQRDRDGGFDLVYRLVPAPGSLVLRSMFSLSPDYAPRSLAAARLLFPGDLDRALDMIDQVALN